MPRVMPRYFTDFDSPIFWTLIRKFRFLVITLLLALNITISVLLVLRDNLFALIQSTAHFRSLLIDLFISLMIYQPEVNWYHQQNDELC